MNRCPQCGADRWTVDENAPYCENSWHREATTDDDEPITREWVLRDYVRSCISVTDKLRLFVRPSGRVDLNGWDIPLPHIRTRGQLRQLLALLGYQEKDSVNMIRLGGFLR